MRTSRVRCQRNRSAERKRLDDRCRRFHSHGHRKGRIDIAGVQSFPDRMLYSDDDGIVILPGNGML
jgi:hypothetical protein